MNNQRRDISADIIRCLALFFVVSVHFLLNNGFYAETVASKRMFVMTVMRTVFIICVPLFITLSGYLLSKKELSGKYYKRITKIILTYILASVACMVYSVVFLHQELTIKMMILKILDFSGAPYSWYIEMYMGLFLIIPFLNILYNNIPSQKWKIALIVTFVALTALPSMLNVYNFNSPSWWAAPAHIGGSNQLIPAWWVGIYPVTYYFIGCYLKEYGLKIKKIPNILLIAACVLLSGLYSYWRSYNATFVWGAWCAYPSLFNTILTILVFALIINTDFSKVPAILARFIQKISGLCLGAYLLSWIFDSWLYPILKQKVTDAQKTLEYYFVIVPIVFVLSLVLSYLMSKVQLLLELLIAKIGALLHKKQAVPTK